MLGIFEGEDNLAGKPGVYLVNPVHIHERGAVDAEKPCGVKTALEFGDGLVDAVPASAYDGVGELVVGNEISYCIEVEMRCARRLARRCGAGNRAAGRGAMRRVP